MLFQCKRYGARNNVSPSQVRDFRGAMQGRADKGLILTTGTFTVDGDKLVAMFERVPLGLRPVQTFTVDQSFFSEFSK